MDRKPQFNNMNEKRVEQNSEAFLNLANDSVGMERQQEAVSPSQPTEKDFVNNAVPGFRMGPKYLEALDVVNREIDLRAFEVELPILKNLATVSPLNGKEEQMLRTSSVGSEKFLLELNRILYEHTVFSDIKFSSLDHFLSSIYPQDKTMLIWALMVASYLTLPDMERQCEKCGKNYIVDAVPKDLIHHDSIPKAWDKDKNPTDYTVFQPVLEDGYITFEIGLPSEKTRLLVTSLISPDETKANVESGNMFSYVDSIMYFTRSITIGTGNNKIVLTDMVQDIMPFLRNLPPKVTDAVRKDIDITIFDEYMPKFYLDTKCSHCGHETKVYIDPEMAFFRKTILI